MACVSTKVRINQLILEVESTSNELFEILLQSKSGDVDTSDLLQQLVEKDKQIKAILQEARIQLEHERKTKLINMEIEKIDAELTSLDSNLQQAEGALATMLDSTHSSLESVRKALANPLNVDDLIRFAHRISASFAIAAPPDFVSAAVDARRPYPTDIQLRAGWLAQQAPSTSMQASGLSNQATGSGVSLSNASTGNQLGAAGGQSGAGLTVPQQHAGLAGVNSSASGLTPALNVATGYATNTGSHAYTPFGGASNCEFMSSSSSESESSADEQ